MSSATKSPPAFVGWLRDRLPMRELAVVTLLFCMFSQGLGGALTASSTVALASATLIVVGGTPLLGFRNGVKYRKYGWSMLSLGTRGEERTRIFRTFRGGFTVDAATLRWVYVFVAGLTSLGINIGIAVADSSIGTGPRMTIMALGPLMAGVTLFVIDRQWNQLILRVLILGGIVFAVALFNSGGTLELHGLIWAAVVALHMFTVQKAMTAFGTEAFDSETNKELSQRYRDIGMTLANVVCLVLIVPWALLHNSFPTPDKFAGASLSVWLLYLLIPLGVMAIPVLGMNWTRTYLDEEDQAMWTSTAPVWGAIAALLLAFIGWVTTPALDGSQWVGIGVVVLAALGAGIDVSFRAKVTARFAQKDRELKQFNRWLEEANAEASRMVAQRDEANAERDAAVAQLTSATAGRAVLIADRDAAKAARDRAVELLNEAKAAFEQLQTELAAPNAEAQPLAKLGGVSVGMVEGSFDVQPDGEAILDDTTGLTVWGDNYTIVGNVQPGASLKEGHFTGLVVDGTVSNGGGVTEVRQAELIARPGGSFTIKKTRGESSLGASSVE